VLPSYSVAFLSDPYHADWLGFGYARANSPSDSLVADDSRNFRLHPVHIARAPFVFPTCDVRTLCIPLLSQADLVAHCRRRLLPLCRAQEIMDHPHANDHRFPDALDVVYRPGING
jgi:hypothetical protein